MGMSIVAIAIAGGITYLWLLRGFFSALLHMVCVIAAGAIAFAVWEPASLAIIKMAPRSGFLSFIAGSGFAIGLIVPFALSLAILRIMMDKAVPSNAQAEKVPDMVGGGICGLVSGVVTAGIVVIGTGCLWLKQDFWGSQRLKWDNSNGSLTQDRKLILPVDDIVAALYGRLSTSAFEPTPEHALARRQPYLADVPSTIRRTRENGKGRNFVKPTDVSITGSYTVGADESWRAIDGFNIQDALRSRGETSTQRVVDRNKRDLAVDGSYLVGYVLSFREGARERQSSQVNVTTAQIRLNCVSFDGTTYDEFFPVAVISRADLADIRYERFRMSDESGLPSVQADAAPLMAFEFVVPAGFKPRTIHIKGIPIDVHNMQPQRFGNGSLRQVAIDNGALMAGTQARLSEDKAITVDLGTEPRTRGISESDTLPRGTVLQDGTLGALRTTEDRRIASGEQLFNLPDMSKPHLEPELRVSRFAMSTGVHLIQVQVTPGTEGTNAAIDIGQAPIAEASRDLPVYLVDTQGNRYACIGYVYKGSQGKIRYTRDRPLTGLSELPSLPSRTQRNLNIWLLFEITRNVDIAGFAVGDEMMVKFQDPISFGE